MVSQLLIIVLLLVLVSPITSCVTDYDCQLNGACVNSECVCDKGWTGPLCSMLKEGRSWVLWPQVEAQPLSAAWGSSIWHDKNSGTYHMWSTAVYQKKRDGPYITCFHTQGTQIVHSTSSSITGPYSYVGIATLPETNNPHVVYTRSGELLLYHLNDNVPLPDIPACTGAGPTGGCQTAAKPGLRTPCGGVDTGTVGIAVAEKPEGPWKTIYPFCELGESFSVISNPSPYLASNDTVVVAFRYTYPVTKREAIAVVFAENYKGPYRVLNPDATPLNSEDPFLYSNKRGYHILLHQYNCSCSYGDPKMIPGAHLYSRDAKEWSTSLYPLYTTAITFHNGTQLALNYRERPELISDEQGNPKWLITGAEWGHKYKYPAPGGACQSVTLITEILD